MNRIKELREKHNLRQADVAEKTGIDQRSISNYETGKTNPDSYAIIKLAEFFNVTSDYLLGISDTDYSNLQIVIKELEDMKKRITVIQKYLNSKDVD